MLPRKNIVAITNAALLAAALLLAAAAQACAHPAAPKDTRADDEATIRAYSQALNEAVRTKNVDTASSFYADDTLGFGGGGPTLTTKEATRADMQNDFSVPGWTISWKTVAVVVSRSGDLAYEHGRYTLATMAKDGKPETKTGNYLLVWRKLPGDDWKIAVDTDAEDPPSTPPSK
jgi:ketosteroid isomerase-like protein